MKNHKYKNYKKWVESSSGKLFITGYTGSGKTTLAKQLALNYNVKLISLDEYINIDKTYVNLLKNNNNYRELNLYYASQLKKAINEILESKEKLIVEGIQIFLHKDIKVFQQHSVIILKTNVVKSFVRALRRNYKEYKTWSLYTIISDIYHNLFYKELKCFRKLY